MNNIFLIVLLIFVGCTNDSSKRISSGLAFNDPINSDPTVTLNFRINQNAINAYHSLAFLNQLETWNDAAVPANWIDPGMVRIRNLFRFLHKRGNSEDVTSMKSEAYLDLQKLVFKTTSETYVLFANKNVTLVKWMSDLGRSIEMTQQSTGTWLIQEENSALTWTVDDKKLCRLNDCVHF
jgi:hypothetical protein